MVRVRGEGCVLEGEGDVMSGRVRMFGFDAAKEGGTTI
jgi:hypothetical protein